MWSDMLQCYFLPAIKYIWSSDKVQISKYFGIIFLLLLEVEILDTNLNKFGLLVNVNRKRPDFVSKINTSCVFKFTNTYWSM